MLSLVLAVIGWFLYFVSFIVVEPWHDRLICIAFGLFVSALLSNIIPTD